SGYGTSRSPPLPPRRFLARRGSYFTPRLAPRPYAVATDRSEAWWSQAGSNRLPPACHAGALPAELWPRILGDEPLPVVLLDVCVDDVADVVLVFLFFEEAGGIVVFVVFDFNVFDLGIGVDHRHHGIFFFGFYDFFFLVVVARNDQRRLIDNHFFFLDFVFGLGVLCLGALVLVVFFLGHGLCGHRFGHTRAALLVERLRLESEFALRALDGPLLEVVKPRRAVGAHALYSKIRLDQSQSSRMKSVS